MIRKEVLQFRKENIREKANLAQTLFLVIAIIQTALVCDYKTG